MHFPEPFINQKSGHWVNFYYYITNGLLHITFRSVISDPSFRTNIYPRLNGPLETWALTLNNLSTAHLMI